MKNTNNHFGKLEQNMPYFVKDKTCTALGFNQKSLNIYGIKNRLQRNLLKATELPSKSSAAFWQKVLSFSSKDAELFGKSSASF